MKKRYWPVLRITYLYLSSSCINNIISHWSIIFTFTILFQHICCLTIVLFILVFWYYFVTDTWKTFPQCISSYIWSEFPPTLFLSISHIIHRLPNNCSILVVASYNFFVLLTFYITNNFLSSIRLRVVILSPFKNWFIINSKKFIATYYIHIAMNFQFYL